MKTELTLQSHLTNTYFKKYYKTYQLQLIALTAEERLANQTFQNTGKQQYVKILEIEMSEILLMLMTIFHQTHFHVDLQRTPKKYQPTTYSPKKNLKK